MKNIHILPTDKPSRLWINNLLQGKLELSKEMLIGSNTAQNIYITSNDNNNITDEGVQHIAGTWVLDTINNKVFKASVNIISDDDIQSIILTTDEDLIKDGVQAIDDEFLEWFCKNPSCEEVEITHDIISVNDGLEFRPILGYKIIIPKEEPKKIDHSKVIKVLPRMVKESFPKKQSKQEKSMKVTVEELAEIAKILTYNSVNKQETLEEAALIYASKPRKFGTRMTFIDGAKWQEQQTIEEVFEWLTTNNYLTDLKETLIENFKNR